jgi:hypothetical protein
MFGEVITYASTCVQTSIRLLIYDFSVAIQVIHVHRIHPLEEWRERFRTNLKT